MRITSWIVEKSQPRLKKLSGKKLNSWRFFYPPRALSYKSLIFDQSQIEETNKQIKLRLREVDHSLMAMLSVWKTV